MIISTITSLVMTVYIRKKRGSNYLYWILIDFDHWWIIHWIYFVTDASLMKPYHVDLGAGEPDVYQIPDLRFSDPSKQSINFHSLHLGLTYFSQAVEKNTKTKGKFPILHYSKLTTVTVLINILSNICLYKFLLNPSFMKNYGEILSNVWRSITWNMK